MISNLQLIEIYADWDKRYDRLSAAECSDILHRARDEGLAASFHPLFSKLPAEIRPAVLKHSISYVTFANKQYLTLIKELLELEQVFDGCGYPVLLVKGAAYRLSAFGYAKYRLFSDIDLLVGRSNFKDAVKRLKSKGYIEHTYSNYERNYYMNWSHQYPPLRHLTRTAEVDLHHSIFFSKSAIQVDIDQFISNATQLSNSVFYLPAASDMFIHACLHLFYQEEQQKLTKDLIDLHCLYNEIPDKSTILQSALLCNKHSAVTYGLQVQQWFFQKTLTPTELKFIQQNSTPWRSKLIRFMLTSIARQSGLSHRLCSFLWYLRGHLIKMSLPLLAYHTVMKSFSSYKQKVKLSQNQRKFDQDCLPQDARNR